MSGLDAVPRSVVSPERSRTMRAIKSKNTKPELHVRALLTRLGYRYRIHADGVPGRPDLAFIGRRKAIFVHGCFWHQHPSPCCPLRKKPLSNLSYWVPKLARNRERDASNLEALAEMGWQALEIWECELRDEKEVLKKVRAFLS